MNRLLFIQLVVMVVGGVMGGIALQADAVTLGRTTIATTLSLVAALKVVELVYAPTSPTPARIVVIVGWVGMAAAVMMSIG